MKLKKISEYFEYLRESSQEEVEDEEELDLSEERCLQVLNGLEL